MSDVFVSYKAEDRARVRPLVAALEASGLDVWWDARLDGGATWRDAIAEELDKARCVLVVWSRRSVGPEGRFVRDEATRALKRGCYLPVAIDKVEPPLGFGESQVLPLSGWKGDPADPCCQAVIDTIHSRLGRGQTAASGRRDRIRLDRRALVAGGAAVALGAAGFGGWRLIRPRSDDAAIAVLPFANLSGDPAQAYFSDGIAEELRSALSRIAGLKVVARTSSEAVGGEDAKTAAARLGVANILTGSVRRSPEMLRITAQLVDGRHGVERWSASYDRPVGDSLQIQSDIAGRVADALSIRLGSVDRQRLAQGGTHSAEAQDLLLRAMVVDPNDSTTASLDRAIGLADAALALDPNYGDAMAMKAELQGALAGSHSPTAAQSHATYRTAQATARRAIELAPQSRLGYSVLASVLDQQLDRRGAQVAYQRMLQLPGNEGRTLGKYAIFLSELGRPEEALAVANRAVEVDPLNPLVRALRMMVLFNARRYSEAAGAAAQMLKLRPGAAWPRAITASCHFMLGDTARAAAEFAAMGGEEKIAATWVAAVAIRQGDRQKADRILAAMQAEASDAAHFQYAEIYAQEGDIAKAVDSLYSAYQARDPGLTMIKVDQLLDPLRNDARFKALIAKLDFPT